MSWGMCWSNTARLNYPPASRIWGSKATGREGGYLQIVLNGLTGLGDRTALSVFNTAQLEEQTVVQLTHGMALGTDGLRIEGRLLYGRGEPDTGANFRTETVIGNLELSYPIVRKQAWSLYAAGGFDIVEQSVDFGSTALSEDNLRIVYGRLGFDMADKGSINGRKGYSPAEPRWRLASTLEARLGIGALGASKGCTPLSNCQPPNVPISNFLADPSAFVLRANALIEYRPVPELTFAMAPRVQYSGSALLNYEQYSIGNYTIGRGLNPGTVLGDAGIGSSFELRYGKIMPGKPDGIAVQPFAFFDAAVAWNNDDGLTDDPRSAYSAGGGLRARWGNRLDGNLVLAAPLKKAGFQTAKGDVRVLFTIRARLAPWDPS